MIPLLPILLLIITPVYLQEDTSYSLQSFVFPQNAPITSQLFHFDPCKMKIQNELLKLHFVVSNKSTEFAIEKLKALKN